MDIALVYVKENYTPVPPLGIMYIGTLLKQHGYRVLVLDMNRENANEVLQRLKRANPLVVGFSVMTTNYGITRLVNRRAQEELPYSYFCWGGPHPTALPVQTIEENALDFLVCGEGEYTMLEVMQRVVRRKHRRGIDLQGVEGTYYFHDGEIRKNSPRGYIQDIDELPFPDRTLIEDFDSYLAPPGIIRGQFMAGTTPIIASRGCPYNCIFCASHNIHGKAPRLRRPECVLDEMEYLRREFGVNGVMFWDDTFGIYKKWIAAFCAEYMKRQPKVVWGCQTRANVAQDFEILSMMKRAGCIQVDMGVESGSNKILKVLEKGTNVEMIQRSFRNLQALKLDSYTTYIVGSPGETDADIKMTYDIAKTAPGGGVSFLTLSPFPGTRVFELAKQHAWLVPDYQSYDERWTNKESDSPVMAIGKTPREVAELRNQLQNHFDLKNCWVILRAFLCAPKYLGLLLLIVLIHPEYLMRAIRKRKIRGWLEDVYQAFNRALQYLGRRRAASLQRHTRDAWGALSEQPISVMPCYRPQELDLRGVSPLTQSDSNQ